VTCSVDKKSSGVDAEEVRPARASKSANIAAETAASIAKVEFTEWAGSQRTSTQHASQSH